VAGAVLPFCGLHPCRLSSTGRTVLRENIAGIAYVCCPDARERQPVPRQRKPVKNGAHAT